MKTLSKVIISTALFLGLQCKTLPTGEQGDMSLTQQVRPEFADLHIELQAYILSFLGQKDFHRASLVSKGWRDAAFIAGEEKVLDLSSKKLDQKGCQALLRVPFSSLILRGCGLGKANVAILSKCARIKMLDLRDNIIDRFGAEQLARGNLSQLTSLDLSGNHIGAMGARSLVTGNLSALTSLNLYMNEVGDEGVQALAAGNLNRLVSLKLIKNKIGFDGAQSLATGRLRNCAKITYTISRFILC